ncbi:hypothetical protein [Halopenitus persicus]|uniref:hypothetical protein n=1 Tax=Halopenitus persicus TaxID=1048396 RepID=UPI000BBA4A5E|nr:hypothetical protein [Halopenitus persicus]
MSGTTIETIDTLLESVEESVEDPDVGFKLRTARQLLLLIDEREEAGQEALHEADLESETRKRLQELGYID